MKKIINDILLYLKLSIWCFFFFFFFRLVGIAALLTTVISCICIFIQIIMDGLNTTTIPASYHTPSSFKDFFLAFGTILFVFGGASTFPTIQNDMINRNDFYKSVRIAFTGIISHLCSVIYILIKFFNFIMFRKQYCFLNCSNSYSIFTNCCVILCCLWRIYKT